MIAVADPATLVATGAVGVGAIPLLWVYLRTMRTQDQRISTVERKLARCEKDRSVLIYIAQQAGVQIPDSMWADSNGHGHKPKETP